MIKSYYVYGFKILFFSSLLSFVACSNPPQSYFPLQTGMMWQYGVVRTTMNGVEQHKYVYESLPEKLIDNNPVYFRKAITGSEYGYKKDDSGVYQIGYIRGNDPNRELVSAVKYEFKYPLQIDSSWHDEVLTVALDTGGPRGVVIVETIPVQSKIASLTDKVKVKAGTFSNCLRIETEGELFLPEGKYQYIRSTTIKIKETRWYALGVGLIKSDRRETTDARNLSHGEYFMELEIVKT